MMDTYQVFFIDEGHAALRPYHMHRGIFRSPMYPWTLQNLVETFLIELMILTCRMTNLPPRTCTNCDGSESWWIIF